MNKTEIEAALERSLRQQVKVPRLDRKFDSAVWARIEAAESAAAAPTLQASAAVPNVARWLYIVNVVGLASVAIFVSVFGAQWLAGQDINGMMPAMSAATRDHFMSSISMGIAGVAVVVGLMFTPLGRLVREELG